MSKRLRCAIYTRKSTDEGLEQDFNSLDAQREACEAFIQSQKGLGWIVQKKRYDDGGLSGGTMNRPALQMLLADIDKGKIDLVVVYKVDRLTRSLMDFARIIETFDGKDVSFVSVTQQFNTANSMGRLTLNVLLSFAQFEREVTAERIRDKISASKKKGMWMGGLSPLGYDAVEKKLVVNEDEAAVVRSLFDLYLELKSVRKLKDEADRRSYITKIRKNGHGEAGGQSFTRGHLYQLLHNPIYAGEVTHKGKTYPGQHKAIIDRETWSAVQTLLDDQATKRRSPCNQDNRCLLTGILLDEAGDRLSPTYCRKNGRRYRYYISKHLMQGTDGNDGWRIPADQIERTVLQELGNYLRDGSRLVEALHGNDPTPTQVQTTVRTATTIAKTIKQGQLDEVHELIRELIDRIEIKPDRLRIALSESGLSRLFGAEYVTRNRPIVLEIPITIRRRGIENKIVLPGKSTPPAPDENLIKLVADSHRWFTSIANGEVETVRQLSEETGVDEGDVSRFLPLAFLAPDIVESILAGKQPVELTSEKLKRLRSLPKSWEEQRRLLGFAT
ncbi:MAG: recombinase family protein [Rhodospirillales bacterium]|nr:recombinase family protein [Rhodospirillales bacterium]